MPAPRVGRGELWVAATKVELWLCPDPWTAHGHSVAMRVSLESHRRYKCAPLFEDPCACVRRSARVSELANVIRAGCHDKSVPRSRHTKRFMTGPDGATFRARIPLREVVRRERYSANYRPETNFEEAPLLSTVRVLFDGGLNRRRDLLIHDCSLIIGRVVRPLPSYARRLLARPRLARTGSRTGA